MIVIADSDVVRKLAYCELLLELLQHLKAPPNQVWVLRALKYQLQAKLKKYPAALRNFEAFLKKVGELPTADPKTLARFPTLDAGEQQIFAVLHDEQRVAQVITGDKNALRHLAQIAARDQEISTRLAQTKIVCFESIVQSLLSARGFGVVNSRMQKWRVAQGADMDARMQEAFPAASSEIHSDQYLQDLRDALRIELQGSSLIIE